MYDKTGLMLESEKTTLSTEKSSLSLKAKRTFGSQKRLRIKMTPCCNCQCLCIDSKTPQQFL
ncbi:hypothetical protein MAR_031626 [Mya arenaria]|uniref:Uncharacterized protein n=1 Tax=Mya arenaria TaxID=6604 RepID=A0ABY7F4C7_MYAAR|nr:hypothetical protein MAR_031626 [Mya arenaria]